MADESQVNETYIYIKLSLVRWSYQENMGSGMENRRHEIKMIKSTG